MSKEKISELKKKIDNLEKGLSSPNVEGEQRKTLERIKGNLEEQLAELEAKQAPAKKESAAKKEPAAKKAPEAKKAEDAPKKIPMSADVEKCLDLANEYNAAKSETERKAVRRKLEKMVEEYGTSTQKKFVDELSNEEIKEIIVQKAPKKEVAKLDIKSVADKVDAAPERLFNLLYSRASSEDKSIEAVRKREKMKGFSAHKTKIKKEFADDVAQYAKDKWEKDYYKRLLDYNAEIEEETED